MPIMPEAASRVRCITEFDRQRLEAEQSRPVVLGGISGPKGGNVPNRRPECIPGKLSTKQFHSSVISRHEFSVVLAASAKIIGLMNVSSYPVTRRGLIGAPRLKVRE